MANNYTTIEAKEKAQILKILEFFDVYLTKFKNKKF